VVIMAVKKMQFWVAIMVVKKMQFLVVITVVKKNAGLGGYYGG